MSVAKTRAPRLGSPRREARDSWKDRAACRDRNVELFFTPGREAEARSVCARCPVREECLDWALEMNVEYGVWGGLDERQRRTERRRRRRTAAGVAS